MTSYRSDCHGQQYIGPHHRWICLQSWLEDQNWDAKELFIQLHIKLLHFHCKIRIWCLYTWRIEWCWIEREWLWFDRRWVQEEWIRWMIKLIIDLKGSNTEFDRLYHSLSTWWSLSSSYSEIEKLLWLLIDHRRIRSLNMTLQDWSWRIMNLWSLLFVDVLTYLMWFVSTLLDFWEAFLTHMTLQLVVSLQIVQPLLQERDLSLANSELKPSNSFIVNKTVL